MDREIMSTDKVPAKPPDDHNQTTLAASKPPATNLAQSDQALNCPRCDSPNTKFCYYNNYSLTQPRHFCKTCRRYWTKGGALRNVPIGGGCRKSKKTKSAATAPSSEAARLKFLSGQSSAMEFQFSGVPFTRLHSANSGGFSQLFSLGGLSSSAAISPCPAIDAVPCTSSLHGFSCTAATDLRLGESGVFRGGVEENIAASIESLSFINQDLHWKLQQQRLAMLSTSSAPLVVNQQQKQPISLPSVGGSKTEACVNGNTNVLLLENSYTVADGNSNINMSTWNEIQTWNDLHHQYSELP